MNERNTEGKIAIIAGSLGALAVAFGWITEEQANQVVNSVVIIAGAIVSAAAVFGYTLSRGIKKAGEGKTNVE